MQRAIADYCPLSRICLVTSGSEVMAFLRREPPFMNAPPPALILLDLNLPRRDGRDILKELRSLSGYKKTPVVIVSGSNKEEDKQCCRQLGANAYVHKPTDFDAYFGGIQGIIRSWPRVDLSPSKRSDSRN